MEIKYAPGAEILIKAKVESVNVHTDYTEYHCFLPGYSKPMVFTEEEIIMKLVDASENEVKE